jgi:hypothetical protein
MEIRTQSKTGPQIPSRSDFAASLPAQIDTLSQQWSDRLNHDPASFAAVEVEIHDQFRRLADLMTASLLAKATPPKDQAQPGKKGSLTAPTDPDARPNHAN